MIGNDIKCISFFFFVHSLTSSAYASERTMASVFASYTDEDASIRFSSRCGLCISLSFWRRLGGNTEATESRGKKWPFRMLIPLSHPWKVVMAYVPTVLVKEVWPLYPLDLVKSVWSLYPSVLVKQMDLTYLSVLEKQVWLIRISAFFSPG